MSDQPSDKIERPVIDVQVVRGHTASSETSTGQATQARATIDSLLNPPLQKSILDWSRRITAYAFYCGVWLQLTHRADFMDLPQQSIPVGAYQIDVGPLLAIVIMLWVAFITQMRALWIVGLPIYLVLAPPLHIASVAFAFVFSKQLKSLLRRLYPADSARLDASVARLRARLLKGWVLLWVFWYVIAESIESVWLFWVPVLLALPMWGYALRLAFRFAMTPPSITAHGVALCSAKLQKSARERAERQTFLSGLPLLLWIAVGAWLTTRRAALLDAMRLYRESIGVFSVGLIIAVAASSFWFGLVARALFHTSPRMFDGYPFFTSASMLESTLWAFGCMATTIDFPTNLTSIRLKLLHSAVLAAGLFQITYLIACFSMLASNQTTRNSDGLRALLDELEVQIEAARSSRV